MHTETTMSEVHMRATPVDHNPNMEEAHSSQHHWRCTLRYQGRRMVVVFTMGAALTHEPTVREVMNCLFLDSMGYDSNAGRFEDWCSDYGYDTDSRKAERTFRAIERQSKALRRMCGEDFDHLCNAYTAED